MALFINRCSRVLIRLNRVQQSRHIMSTPFKLNEVQEKLEKNPYFEKYAKKIADLQQTSPEEFLSRVETHFVEEPKPQQAKPKEERSFSSLLKPKEKLNKIAPQDVTDESLDKVMKVELIKDKSAEEIKEIWLKYHLQKDVIAATIPTQEYDKMMEQAKKSPIFLFVLPRSQGYEFIMAQFQNNTTHFTPLICYQVHKENAPECLTIKNYTEFKDSKGIVLMRGEFDKTVIDGKEAQCLANQLQLYYNQKSPEKLKLLETFTLRPDEFKHMDLIKQIESLSL